MKKRVLILGMLCIGSALALNKESAPLPSTNQIIDGVYKSTTSETYIKIANIGESGLILPVVAHRKTKIESDSTVHGTSFDERVFFKKINPTIYVSSASGTSCVATIIKVGPDTITIKVNSIDECFNKYSQFNATAPDSDQSKIIEPFINAVFKLNTSPVVIKYFSAF